MEITCVTSYYDYTDGILLISDWIVEEFRKLDIKYDVIVYNDNENNVNLKSFKLISNYKNFKIIHVSKNTADLRIPYKMASQNAITKNHDAVLIIEADAIPDSEAFEKMLEVYLHPFKKPLASVSPMYTWNKQHCYPTNTHWLTDGLNIPGGRAKCRGAGTVADVGEPGVPFVFSLWNPEALDMIHNGLPTIVSLDQQLGKLLHEKGYHHLRVLEASIEHVDGGKRSWKNKNILKHENDKINTFLKDEKKKIVSRIVESKPIISVSPTDAIKNKVKNEIVVPRKIIYYNNKRIVSNKKILVDRSIPATTEVPIPEKISIPEPVIATNYNLTDLIEIENNIKIKLGLKLNFKISPKRIAILLHLYYVDLWNEVDKYLNNMYEKFDLYVTLVDDVNYKLLLDTKSLILEKYPDANVFIIDNRGLDIGGFLYVLDYIISKNLSYDYLIKLHSKKSIHSANIHVGNEWRLELYNSILGSKKITEGISKILSLYNDIGMIGSKRWHITTKEKRSDAYCQNFKVIENLIKEFNLKVNAKELEFIGGTMFWADFETIIKAFKKINLKKLRSRLKYGPHTDHKNSSVTHSIERLLGLIVINDKKKIFSI